MDFEELLQSCRLCLQRNGKFRNLNGENLDIQRKILGIFKTDMDFDRNYSNLICDNCFRVIETFWKFYVNVLENQKTFETSESCAIALADSKTSIGDCSRLTRAQKNILDNEFQIIADGDSIPLKNVEPSKMDVDVELPNHLKIRMTKTKGDEKIREFVNLTCDQCVDVQFDTFKSLQEHYQSTHNCKGYVVCCERKIYRKDRLMSHIINHVNPNAFACPKCDQSCKSKLLLKNHMKQHLPVENRPHKCTKCSQRFVLRSQLTNHEASHLTDDQKKFVCDECGKAFALKFVMMKHKQIHSKERNYVCEICAKSFVTKPNLQVHMASHINTTQPRVQCPVCKSWYKNRDTLRSHMRRHRDNRVHTCPVCSKECTTSSTLSSHVRYVHHKIYDYECNVCDRQFRRKVELTEHMARHTGQPLYHCPYCPKTFSSNSNYFTHRKYRHKFNNTADDPTATANIDHDDDDGDAEDGQLIEIIGTTETEDGQIIIDNESL